MGAPGEVLGGAMAERLAKTWKIIIEHVGDDPETDPHDVYAETWRNMLRRYSSEADLTIESDGWTAIYLAEPDRMEAVAERFVFADEL